MEALLIPETTQVELERIHQLLSNWISGETFRLSQLSEAETLKTATMVEQIHHLTEYAQLLVAQAVEQNLNIEAKSKPGELLQARLQITRAEARRRIELAAQLLPSRSLTAAPLDPPFNNLAELVRTGTVDSRTAGVAVKALEEASVKTSANLTAAVRAGEDATAANLHRTELLADMEKSLVRTMRDHDIDFLRTIIRRWDTVIDQDGTLPDEAELRHRQGIFKDREHRGLTLFKIFADQSQTETLLTVLNAGSNPRVNRSAEAIDSRSRAQRELDALVSALGAALSTSQLPATGGQRPQVHVTIGYQELLGQLKHSGTAKQQFTGPVPPQTIRRIACDAEVIPVLLGGHGEVLDLGRKRRLFSPGQRAALLSRDGGCSFPECTIPAGWCEAHHVNWWSRGGESAVSNGALLCNRHHHLIHQEEWKLQITAGIPEFLPPPWIDPEQKPRRNLYFRV
ncbi:HNH endonuclease signature motif containing protein [Psychromicrobium lacuslunae]|uniref:HNH endonuclease signature motif containing protein n=1 Tax=Psychromicrobium lacuslunae TaxID=1618207 RepID=UPI0006990018|nr:HNH endonuclease signature motif containing protein [Psychromicrobium lacuslunae]